MSNVRPMVIVALEQREQGALDGHAGEALAAMGRDAVEGITVIDRS